MTGLCAAAAPLSVTVRTPLPASPEGFKMGTARAPDGSTLSLDNRSLLLNGKRWTPVMGEFHYSRYPAAEWRDELRKMKQGGIDIVATYVFWIHHEEVEGRWDWTGDRDLRSFVQVAGEVGLKVIVRCGPWCHGEVRNGGVPDWAVTKGWTLRSDDTPYLDHVKVIYSQIAAQLSGLLWKEGGPVIGIQLENEYGGPAEHLLRLKQIAQEVGLDVPVYTRTGWPALKTPMPFGEIVPLWGSYAEGFWDRELVTMPGRYWCAFRFSTQRTDENIANEQFGRDQVADAPDVARYPYLTCEIGGGMVSSYHRRILIDPKDVESTVIVKLGSGSNSPGYYMYHGGTNPEGKLGTLMEQQATAMTNWNDMPVKNYDFQTPLGQYGQVRPHYRMLRRLHTFLHDFGPTLADMVTSLPDQRALGRDDTDTLRWAVRSDGCGGYVFLNNYERLKAMPAKNGVQFSVTLDDGSTLLFPEKPITLPAGTRAIWPFNLELSHGLRLAWATAQPLCVTTESEIPTYYFAETPGIAAKFAVTTPLGVTTVIAPPATSRIPFLSPPGNGGQRVRIVLLSEADSLALSKGDATGAVGFDVPAPTVAPRLLVAEVVRAAGPLREIFLGHSKQPVAAAPSDADFAQAAVWRIKLPQGFDPATEDMLLRFHYVGDVARVYIGEKFITDDFYNGAALEIGLRRHAAELKNGELTVTILPLRKDAVIGEQKKIHFSGAELPDFAGQESVVRVDRVELVPRVGIVTQPAESAAP